METILDDDSIMPIGPHKGKKMEDVPGCWLEWFWKENENDYRDSLLDINKFEVMEYIEDNLELIVREANYQRNTFPPDSLP